MGTKSQNVSSYFYYMWNAWCEPECKIVFQKSTCNWQHFWEKWCGICHKHGVWGAAERFYAELTEPNRELLVSRECECYDGNEYIGG